MNVVEVGPDPATEGSSVSYLFSHPASGAQATVVTSVTSGSIDFLNTGVDNNFAYFNASGGGVYDTKAFVTNFGSIAKNGCSNKPHKIEFTFNDFDDGTSLEVLNSPDFSVLGGAYTESPVGTFTADPGNSNLALSSTHTSLGEITQLIESTNSNNLDFGFYRARISYYDSVCVTLDCDDNFISATDSTGATVAEGDVNYAI